MNEQNFKHGDMTVWVEPEEQDVPDAAVTHELLVEGETVSQVTAPASVFVPFGVLNRPATAPKTPTR